MTQPDNCFKSGLAWTRKTNCQEIFQKSTDMIIVNEKITVASRRHLLNHLIENVLRAPLSNLFYSFIKKVVNNKGNNSYFLAIISNLVIVLQNKRIRQELLPIEHAYSRVSNKRRPTFINFWNFFQGLRSYLRAYVYWFCQIFLSFLLW